MTTTQARKGDYTPEQWANACILHWGFSDAAARSKNNHAIPVKKPDGTPDPELMGAAVRALVNSGAPQDQARDAARELLRLYDRIDDNPPDSLKGLAGRVSREFSGETEGSETADLAAIERDLDALRGERCFDAGGALISSKAQEFASSKNIPYPEAERRLRGIGAPESAREDVIVADLAEDLADREGIDFAVALIEVQRDRGRREPEAGDAEPPTLRTSTADGEDVRIADLADSYAEEHEVSYETALVEVQRERR